MAELACAFLAALAFAATPEAEAPAPQPSKDLLMYLAEFGDAEDRHADPAEVDAALAGERAGTTAPDPRNPDDDNDDAPRIPDR